MSLHSRTDILGEVVLKVNGCRCFGLSITIEYIASNVILFSKHQQINIDNTVLCTSKDKKKPLCTVRQISK